MRDPLTQAEIILKTYVHELPEPDQIWSHEVKRAIVRLNEHLFSPECRLARMKKICRVSGRNFSLRFKHYVGMPPVRYISHHRIEAARLLLLDEQLRELPVSEIAFAVGYERTTTFATAFRKKTGLPPHAWRDRQLKKPKKK